MLATWLWKRNILRCTICSWKSLKSWPVPILWWMEGWKLFTKNMLLEDARDRGAGFTGQSIHFAPAVVIARSTNMLRHLKHVYYLWSIVSSFPHAAGSEGRGAHVPTELLQLLGPNLAPPLSSSQPFWQLKFRPASGCRTRGICIHGTLTENG